MNIAGALSMTIFILTILTVVAALLSYMIFKARERSRKRAAPAASVGSINLIYFVEYTLPGMVAEPQHTELVATGPDVGGRPVLKYVLATLALAVLGTGSWYGYYLYRGKTAVAVPGTGGSGGGTTSPAQPARSAPPDLRALGSHAASLFPVKSLDANNDGVIQPEERERLHQQIPQFIVVSSDDNGSVQGLQWMKQEFTRRGFWSKVHFFLTGNYLSGRKNYLGGDIDRWWQTLLDEAYIGLHGTTHEPGADEWSVKHWDEENSTVNTEVRKRLKLPPGWTWDAYPLSSRAPFLMLTDTYFQSLEHLRPALIFDSSLVLHPGGPIMVPPRAGVPRDVHWPFTLDTALPDTLDPPYLPSSSSRAKIASHPFWEFPMYAWYLRPPKAAATWQPSMDYNLWKLYGCSGDKANASIVAHLMENLKAHYEGNRVPFHLGLHANNYDDKEQCKRATIAALLEQIARFAQSHARVEYISIPDLFVWLKKMERS